MRRAVVIVLAVLGAVVLLGAIGAGTSSSDGSGGSTVVTVERVLPTAAPLPVVESTVLPTAPPVTTAPAPSEPSRPSDDAMFAALDEFVAGPLAEVTTRSSEALRSGDVAGYLRTCSDGLATLDRAPSIDFADPGLRSRSAAVLDATRRYFVACPTFDVEVITEAADATVAAVVELRAYYLDGRS